MNDLLEIENFDEDMGRSSVNIYFSDIEIGVIEERVNILAKQIEELSFCLNISAGGENFGKNETSSKSISW